MGVFLRLLDSTGDNLIDSISGDYEDSFTLETFGELTEEFFEDTSGPFQKTFIIARVETRDPKQPDKVLKN
jgi:hypothetical protein